MNSPDFKVGQRVLRKTLLYSWKKSEHTVSPSHTKFEAPATIISIYIYLWKNKLYFFPF